MKKHDKYKEERKSAETDARNIVTLERLCEKAKGRQHHSFKLALGQGDGTRVIAEMKKASPSAGLLQPDYDPAAIARGYLANGAVAISVLTEPLHFLGKEEHLHLVRNTVELPILRKDFMCDVYQIAEAAAWGADVILLIAAMLDDAELKELYASALEFGLDVLAEVHTREELERVLPLEEAVVGVNSRNLKTLKTDLKTAHELARYIPAARISVAESGISSRAEIDALEKAGYDGFLIGEALVGGDDPGGRLAELAGRG
jgi:indole-3-glycerol phosphate synthase